MTIKIGDDIVKIIDGKFFVECKECHGILTITWEDNETPTVEQCKTCTEDAYDDGIIIGAMLGKEKVEQEE